MASQQKPVQFLDRTTGAVCEETIYGDGWLRALYERGWGRPLLWMVRSRWFSRLYGWLQHRPASRKKIAGFVAQLRIDPTESERPPEDYASFAAFFTRKLKPERRPLPADPAVLASPADCRLLVYRGLAGATVVPVKGVRYTLAELLRDSELAARYEGGDLLSCRLCPADYHRFHFPAAGTPGSPRDLAGPLYSVNPLALAAGLAVFTENHRVLVPLAGTRFGDLVMIEVGATCVGTIVNTHAPGVSVARGAEAGYFDFGGSSLLVLFPAGRVHWDEDLLAGAARGLETLVKMGERMGRAANHGGAP